MENSAFEKILGQIASISQVSPQELRAKMQLAMDEALSDPDPAVQAMWASIPKENSQPTLEEFMRYLIEKKLLSP